MLIKRYTENVMYIECVFMLVAYLFCSVLVVYCEVKLSAEHESVVRFTKFVFVLRNSFIQKYKRFFFCVNSHWAYYQEQVEKAKKRSEMVNHYKSA